MPPKTKVCKDCLKVWDELDLAPQAKPRPAPHPGPRCATHHRAEKKRRKAAAHETYAQKTYGLGPGDYARLRELQGGRCAICRRATGATKALAVDHDHACCAGPVSCGNCVRGLLCSPCNRTLGHARDELDFFKRAHRYLKNPPARQLEVDP